MTVDARSIPNQIQNAQALLEKVKQEIRNLW